MYIVLKYIFIYKNSYFSVKNARSDIAQLLL
jgi:hypothetical protein